MKCNNCEFENKKDSLFCENCGEQLKVVRRVKPKRTLADEIDDVIFVPKQKKNVWPHIVIAVLIGLCLLFGLYILGSATSPSSAFAGLTAPTPTPSINVYCLRLTDDQMYGNSYYSINPRYQAVLHNACDFPIKNVVLRVNFFKGDAPDTGATPVDTQYVTIADFIGPNDSSSINTIINTNADTSGYFKWNAAIYSSE